MKKRCIIKGLPKAAAGGNMPFYKQQGFGNRVNYSNINTNNVDTGYTSFMSDSEIGKTIKEVDREDATIEAEKGEYILKSNQELYHIGGKSHSKGGTPILAEPGDFIYSNTKDMRIKGEDLIFIDPSVKEKSKDYKAGRTPAELVKKFNLDKLNDYIAKKDNKDTNPFDKKTAESSLAMGNKKLAEIAMIQEKMKGFPNGLPETISQYLPDTSMMGSEIAEAKRGGFYKNGGYLPKAQDGLTFYEGFVPGFKDNFEKNKDKYIIPELKYSNSGKQSKSGDFYGDVKSQQENIAKWYKRNTGLDLDYKNKAQVQKAQELYNSQFKEYSGGLDYQSGINKVGDGMYGNRTNSYIFGKEKAQGIKAGKINLNEFFNLPKEEQSKIVEKYGLKGDDIYKYEKSIINELDVTGPESSTAETSKEEFNMKDSEGDTNPIGYGNRNSAYGPSEKALQYAFLKNIIPPSMLQPTGQMAEPINLRNALAKYDRNPIDAQVMRGITEAYGSLTPQIAAAVSSNYLSRGADSINQGLAQVEGMNLNSRVTTNNQEKSINSNIDLANQNFKRDYGVNAAEFLNAKDNAFRAGFQEVANVAIQNDSNKYNIGMLNDSGYSQNYVINPDGTFTFLPGNPNLNKSVSSGFKSQLGELAELSKAYGVSITDLASAIKALS